MGDSGLRDLELAFLSTSTLESEVALLRARLRADLLGEREIRLAGRIGSQAAIQVLVEEPERLSWEDFRSYSDEAALRVWIAAGRGQVANCCGSLLAEEGAAGCACEVVRSAVREAEEDLCGGEELALIVLYELVGAFAADLPALTQGLREDLKAELVPWLLKHRDPVRDRLPDA